MKKVLIITYYWPPGSGAGVQRWLKFSKYLPASGWEPVIITVDPDYAAYPSIDNTLTDEISGKLRVYRTRATDWFRLYKSDKTKIPSAGFAISEKESFKGKIVKFIRGNFFIPDPRRGWNKYAFREACRIIEEEGIKNIITTSPPHSTQLTGLKLKKKYPAINWIADLRDPWTDIYYYSQFYHTPPAKKADNYYEKIVLKKADRIITVGESLKHLFCEKIPGIESKTVVIANGYDDDDFQAVKAEKPQTFTISYIGTLSGSYPLSGFLDAVNRLANTGYNIKLSFTGAVSPQQRAEILAVPSCSSTEFRPYVDHKEAIKYMMESSVLLLIIPDHHSNRSIITGKLFEYLATGKPILCIGPVDGDAAAILDLTSHGKCAGYNDTHNIMNIIKGYYDEPHNELKPAPYEFSRSTLTKKLVSLLQQ